MAQYNHHFVYICMYIRKSMGQYSKTTCNMHKYNEFLTPVPRRGWIWFTIGIQIHLKLQQVNRATIRRILNCLPVHLKIAPVGISIYCYETVSVVYLVRCKYFRVILYFLILLYFSILKLICAVILSVVTQLT